MESEYFISIYLDARRPKANNKYPVKLRVFTPHPRIQKLYPTKFEFSKKEFQIIRESDRPRAEIKEIRNEMRAIELKAEDIAKKLQPFTIEQFERKYLKNKGDNNDIIAYYNHTIEKMKTNYSYSTALNYSAALKSFLEYRKSFKGKEPSKISFTEITPDWLQKYEYYMLKELERSRTTVSMYVRTLRTIFNSAIRDKEIDFEIYPFGKNKYQPPAVRNVKKALSDEDFDILLNSQPKTLDQYKAKDFWFFSYSCNGMNVKDILLLKYENIEGDVLTFHRAKTIGTSKAAMEPIAVILTGISNKIIEKYGNKDKSPKSYVFPILSNENTEFENHRAVKNFTIFINKNLKKLCKANGLKTDLSTYGARHSYATRAIRDGASMDFVSRELGHKDLKTTQGYFKGFAIDYKREFMKKMMDFKLPENQLLDTNHGKSS